MDIHRHRQSVFSVGCKRIFSLTARRGLFQVNINITWHRYLLLLLLLPTQSCRFEERCTVLSFKVAFPLFRDNSSAAFTERFSRLKRIKCLICQLI